MKADPQYLIQGLVSRGVPQAAAIGIVANMSAESGYNPGVNEAQPLVKGSRGGFGLYQVTGPRRRAYEAFAAERGVGAADVDAQLDFLVHEMNTTEKRARDRVYAATDPIEAARLTSDLFLRPGIPHMDARLSEAARLSGGEYSGGQGNYSSGPPNTLAEAHMPYATMPNALAENNERDERSYQVNLLNPQAFMSRRRFG